MRRLRNPSLHNSQSIPLLHPFRERLSRTALTISSPERPISTPSISKGEARSVMEIRRNTWPSRRLMRTSLLHNSSFILITHPSSLPCAAFADSADDFIG